MAKFKHVYDRTYNSLIEAGADPRTAKKYAGQAYNEFVQQQIISSRRPSGGNPYSRVSAGLNTATGGAIGTDYVQQFKDSQAAQLETTRQQQAVTKKKVSTEIAAQPALQVIKQKRKSLVEMEAKALTRKTGRRALLTSAPGGGSGFYGGYFNGK